MADTNWKQPVQLKDIDDSVQTMEREMKILKAWRFLILRGPAGIGKTYAALVEAKKEGWDVFIQECSGDMGVYDLIGSNILADSGGMAYQAGVVASAVKNAADGKLTLLVMDEINMLPQTVLKELGSLFDFRKAVETPVGRLYGNGNLFILATANSEQESAGFELDVTLQSRGLIVTLDAKDMAQRLAKYEIVDAEAAQLIGASDGVFSIREVEQVLALGAAGFSEKEAMKIVVNKFISTERRKLVADAVGLVFGKAGEELV